MLSVSVLPFFSSACGGRSPAAPPARNLVLITIDTLRADRVGAYGYARAQTPTLDAIARAGVTFERAYTAAPITLPAHATMMTGRYPPRHGARDNGMAMTAAPTLATELQARGFKTAAFVAAFPLDHQFGLARGFDVYGDRLGRDTAGRPNNERPASEVVDEAIAWLRSISPDPAPPAPPAPPALPALPAPRFFLWVHLFEPHAPYGTDQSRPIAERYDEEIATADRAIGRLIAALPGGTDTALVVAGDHGEAFGEHGEYAHSIFVYDTTLRVPLLIRAAGVPRSMPDAVTLADVAPTAMHLLGFSMADVDGIDLSPALLGGTLPTRELYAESFAPLIEFGWAPLRSVRSDTWKFIAAPTPELFDIRKDAAEATNLAGSRQTVVQSLDERVSRYSSDTVAAQGRRGDVAGTQAMNRLRSLGYVGSGSATRNPQSAMAMDRPDPKTRRELAARLAQVTSGELQGPALLTALEAIVRDDPRNGQAHLRLGYARLQAGDCARAEPEFHAAAVAGLPSADIHLGLATCLGRRGDLAGAGRALQEAQRLEPDNPVIIANIGILQLNKGDAVGAIQSLKRAVEADPSLHEARFNLAIAFAKSGRRAEAAAAARELLRRLPSDAPQRPEVERLFKSVQ